MAVLPTSPAPIQVRDAASDREAVQAEFDQIVRHARARDAHRLRRRTLLYEGLTRADIDTFLNFYKARKGRTERFDFTDLIEANVIWKARFSQEGLRWSMTGAFDYRLEFDVEEAP